MRTEPGRSDHHSNGRSKMVNVRSGHVAINEFLSREKQLVRYPSNNRGEEATFNEMLNSQENPISIRRKQRLRKTSQDLRTDFRPNKNVSAAQMAEEIYSSQPVSKTKQGYYDRNQILMNETSPTNYRRATGEPKIKQSTTISSNQSKQKKVHSNMHPKKI